jgi:flagellar basal-body rod protein FlgB
MLNRLTSSIDFQGQALSLRAERQRLLASNIANADTPGYVSHDMNFAQALRDATGQQGPGIGLSAASGSGSGTAGRLDTTQVGHLAGSGGTPGQANLLYSTASQSSLDNNTVDMDRERASFADNAVKYEATLRFINGGVRTMLEAIKGQS